MTGVQTCALPISLEHKVALRYILNGLKKENKIPELLKLSAKMNSYNCSFKTSEDLDKITESEYFTDNIKSKLKKELDLIHKKTVLEILPLKINSAKGCSK